MEKQQQMQESNKLDSKMEESVTQSDSWKIGGHAH